VQHIVYNPAIFILFKLPAVPGGVSSIFFAHCAIFLLEKESVFV
jgi:hypothetical protein